MQELREHAALMDRVYKYQRHIYDLTRKYYLLGRDQLLKKLDVPQNGKVLEIGVGTGRNLLKLHSLRPDLKLFGFDASEAMLETARLNTASIPDIQLGFALAESFKSEVAFGSEVLFDAAFFSYSLSMIPDWRGALEVALHSVKPGGSVYIVDFWDQHSYPGIAQKLLKKWLSLFHVKYKPEWLPYFKDLETQYDLTLEFTPIMGSYAFILRFKVPEAKLERHEIAA